MTELRISPFAATVWERPTELQVVEASLRLTWLSFQSGEDESGTARCPLTCVTSEYALAAL